MAKKKKEKKVEERIEKEPVDVSRYINKQRTLVFSTRGVTHRGRHFIKDLRDLLPHSKKDAKLDTKTKLQTAVTEVCEMKNCNNGIFFEARKKQDLYMWIGKTPNGPSAKFLVQNLHTLEEVKTTGNCLKASRPLLVFDSTFDNPEFQHWRLLKQLMIQVFGTPKGHPKAKPFVDHVFSFFIVDNRIWFRNYQIVYDPEMKGGKKISKDPVLVEIGPRFVINPIKIFAGSFGGPTLWENPSYESPNRARSFIKKRKQGKFVQRVSSKKKREEHVEESQPPPDELADVFH